MSPVANVLDQETIDRLRAIVASHGVLHAARVAGVDRTVIARALAGLGLRRGTVLLLKTNLAALAQSRAEATS